MNVTTPPSAATPSPSPTVRRWLAAGWVAFLAASAGLPAIVYLMDKVVEVSNGDTDLPVPLGIYSLTFLSLWLTALLACWLLMVLQSAVRRGPPGD